MTTPTILTLLSRARDLISNPDLWWDGVCGRGENSQRRDCALTALVRASSTLDSLRYDDALNLIDQAKSLLAKQFPERVRRPWSGSTIVYGNDKLGHSAVLAAYDAAIAQAKIEAR